MTTTAHTLSPQPFSIQTLWDGAGFTPNSAQRDAILHIDGPLFLTAGPGSGKTRVLLWRTVNLLVFQGFKPEEIYLSTFTEKAAHKLKEGLRTYLGYATNINQQPYDLSQMYIGTVHSLCQRILNDRRHFALNRQRTHPPVLLDELGQYFHLARNRNWNAITQAVGLSDTANMTINAIFGRTSESKHLAATNCISFFNRLSEECINPQTALNRLRDGDPALLHHLTDHHFIPDQIDILLTLYDAYIHSLAGENGASQTDFSLLQQAAFSILNESEKACCVFKHVIVDEYQDTNTIQERIFFRLAQGSRNICVVGDDDQALYRFRGATVENFVDFPERCQQRWGIEPRRISLSTNYRSRKQIVNFYTQFIDQCDWQRENDQPGFYRVVDKNIRAHRTDPAPSVVASTPGAPEVVCAEIATLIRKLIDEKKVEDPNQIAFLFPSLKSDGEMATQVQRMKDALEHENLKVYAPRAGRFLEVDESYDVFGLFLHIFGKPKEMEARGRDFDKFKDWIAQIEAQGGILMNADPLLKRFVLDKRQELQQAAQDYRLLVGTIERNHWDLKQSYRIDTMKRVLFNTSGLSETAKRLLSSSYLDQAVADREQKGRPFHLDYIVNRVTSVDWNVLDLFYRLCGFDHFKAMFDAAEKDRDEGPLANLSLISNYLARFIDEYIAMITANLLIENLFQQLFFASYLFALYRLGESEFENTEDPFPKGRIQFLTIHQAKGLEFPVVVLGNPRRNHHEPSAVEIISRGFIDRASGEPLHRMDDFDTMRMFYVALSRAKNLLVIAHFSGKGQYINKPFQELFKNGITRIPELNLKSIPPTKLENEALPKTYSYTSDFINYHTCPRQYMIFRKFDFVPSRLQTMFFGNLVHRTLEDLHHELIRRRQPNE